MHLPRLGLVLEISSKHCALRAGYRGTGSSEWLWLAPFALHQHLYLTAKVTVASSSHFHQKIRPLSVRFLFCTCKLAWQPKHTNLHWSQLHFLAPEVLIGSWYAPMWANMRVRVWFASPEGLSPTHMCGRQLSLSCLRWVLPISRHHYKSGWACFNNWKPLLYISKTGMGRGLEVHHYWR